MAFTIGTAAFTNGSTAVTAVSLTAGKLSYFDRGTQVVVSADPVLAMVEAIAAPSNSEFTLREPWPHATGSYAFQANMTSEGVNTIVERLRAMSLLLEQTNASVGALAGIYASTADGLAATTNGQYFSVVGSGDTFVTLYLNSSGVAVEQTTSPSKSYVDNIASSAVLESDVDDAATPGKVVRRTVSGTVKAVDGVDVDDAATMSQLGVVEDKADDALARPTNVILW